MLKWTEECKFLRCLDIRVHLGKKNVFLSFFHGQILTIVNCAVSHNQTEQYHITKQNNIRCVPIGCSMRI